MAHPKGLLMERLKKQGLTPEFRTANTGPDHEPTFLTDVVVGGEVYGTGQGGTKREAERLAAEEALAYLDRNPLELEAVAESGSNSGPKEQEAKSRSKGPESKRPDSKARKSESQAERSAQKGASRAGDGKAEVDGGARHAEDDEPYERFEGPWPVFEHLLAGIVEVAGERVDEDLKGEEARIAVRDFTLELYKDLLEDLGDVVDVDEED